MDSFEQDDFDKHHISGRTTFYCVFCKESKEFSEHGGQTKESFDNICQACLDGDGDDEDISPEEVVAPLDSLDKSVLRDMIFGNLDAFLTACNGYVGYDPHKLFAKLGGRLDLEEAVPTAKQ